MLVVPAVLAVLAVLTQVEVVEEEEVEVEVVVVVEEEKEEEEGLFKANAVNSEVRREPSRTSTAGGMRLISQLKKKTKKAVAVQANA